MGVKHTPVTIRTPIKAVIDITAIEQAMMDKISEYVVEAIDELITYDTTFEHTGTEMSDSDPAFEIKGTVIQDGTLIHIEAFDLNPPEDSVEPDDIGFTEKQLSEKVISRIWGRTSGDMWKNMIRQHMKLKLEENERQIDEVLF